MIRKSVLALAAMSLMSFGVTQMHAVVNAHNTTYNCAKEQTYTVPPELVALVLTLTSGAIGSYTFTDECDLAVGCFFGAATALMSAFIIAAKHDFADYKSAERKYYDRMMKALLSLMAPSVLASGFACPDQDASRGLKGFGLLGTIATALAWL